MSNANEGNGGWGLYDCRNRKWRVQPTLDTRREAERLKISLTRGKRDLLTNALRTRIFVARRGNEAMWQERWDSIHGKGN